MPNRPIQIDEVPKEYDAAKMQRVLEGLARRLTDRPAAPAKESPKAAPSAPDDVLPWVL